MSWRRRVGLKQRMALSFLLATIAVVLFVELVVTRVVNTSTGTDPTTRALNTANRLAKTFAVNGTANPSAVLGKTPTGTTDLLVVFDNDLLVVASSDQARIPNGSPVAPLLPPDAALTLNKIRDAPNARPASIAALSSRGDRKVAWAIVAVNGQGKLAPSPGFAYDETTTTTSKPPVRISTVTAITVLALPVGLAFGLLATANLRRRLRVLAQASAAVADGDFDQRVVASSRDELGQLEGHFNAMTAGLDALTRRARDLAADNARLAERTRISRDLHDSLSQELFSINMLAGGLRDALEPASPLQARIELLVHTTADASQELRALLLDLHPTALSEQGLASALRDLSASYRTRYDPDVAADITDLQLPVPHAHALLRIAHESLANAVKHADPHHLCLQLVTDTDHAVLSIRDDGPGFDSTAPTKGLGLRLMRERTAELDGSLTVTTSPGGGTTITARLPIPPNNNDGSPPGPR